MSLTRRISLIFAVAGLVFSSLFFSDARAESWPDLGVNLVELRGFSEARREKLEDAVRIFEVVVNSDEFRERVLNFRRRGVEGFVQNDGLSNEQILERVYEGTEDFAKEREYNPPAENHLADFYLGLYTGKKGVVGYSNTGRRRIHINTRYFDPYSPVYIAGNLAHEWMHKLGFHHDFKPTSRRPWSVPYAIGNLVRELGKKVTD